jgi:AraC family transcriptional regulator
MVKSPGEMAARAGGTRARMLAWGVHRRLRVAPEPARNGPRQSRFFDSAAVSRRSAAAYDAAMAWPSAQPVADRIGALARAEPDRLISIDDDGSVVGAVWSHSPVVAQVAGLEQHAIVLHLAGSTLVEKWRGGRMVGHRARIGSVTLVPAQVPTTWALSGHSRVAHLYLDPRQLAFAAERSDGPRCEPELRDFFAETDDVTAALVRLVLAQSTSGALDRLAHDEVTLLLARHLLGRYAAGRPLTAATPRLTLTAATLRRLFDHIDGGLAGELRLAELAALARLSEDHFVRAFKAAVGQTPHQYVLARRIAHAQRLLERGGLPVAAVARAAGFAGASHFAASFRRLVGTSPSIWRTERRH